MIINPFQSFPGVILSAFYYGYMVTQLPGGVLARKFGGATILGLSVGTSGALTMLTPLAARVHVGVLITLRVAIGMAEVKLKFNPFLSLCIFILFYLFKFPLVLKECYTSPIHGLTLLFFVYSQGFVYPAGHALWSQWAPPLERSTLATFNPAGIMIVTFLPFDMA